MTTRTSNEPVLDVAAIKADFPILNQLPSNGRKPLVYLDSAASSQKPQAVIDAVDRFYAESNANIHRGVYQLSERATGLYEQARHIVADFINAADAREVIFIRNTTEAINLVAQAWGRANLKPGDIILVTEMEHHSNLVPWQLIAEQTGARIKAIPLTDDHTLDIDAYHTLLARPAEGGGRDARLEQPRHDQRRGRDRAGCAYGRRDGRDRRGPIGAAPADRRAGDRCRLPGLQRAQDARPARLRRALRQAGAARGDAAVHGRWRDDPQGHDRALDLCRCPGEVRGGHPGGG